ncbi:MAG: hypothetical protein P8L71_03500, partial [Flavobacteriales bacterium]|nr:hypothetical protein [Flavobacteriales bacterium]
MRSFGTKLWHFTAIGTCFGMCFPVIAWLMTLAESSRPLTLSGVVDLHLESNLFYIIDMAPFVIGVLFFVIGKYSLVKLRYLKRLSAFERDLRETQETPMQKMALRKIRVQYIKTFLAAGSTLVAILIMLLIHFNHSNTVNKQLSGVCESIAGQLSSLDINSPEVAAQIEVSRVQFSSLVASQAQWSNTAILVVSLVTLLIISLFVFSHFRIFFPNFVDLQKGMFENTVARKLIGQQAEELKKHSFANANSGTAMCTLNLEGEVEWFNDIFQSNFGEAKLELNASFVKQFEGKFSNSAAAERMNESINSNEEFKELVELKELGKENKYCHITIEPFSDDDGTSLGYFVLQNDVTELVEAKRENDELLRQLQQNLRTAKVIQKNVSERRELIKEFFGDSFVVNKPLQVLSGDYVWFRKLDENKALLCLGDCVGHGVAGSLLANLYAQFLDEITEEETSPDKILI